MFVHRHVNSTVDHLYEARNQYNQKADQLQLKLQNLKYESLHLKQEIAKCRLFVSRHLNVDLVTLEEFKKQQQGEAEEEVSGMPKRKKNNFLILKKITNSCY